MSSVRRQFTPTGEVLLAQCEGCKAYVVVDERAWRGEVTLAPHQEWRPTLLHLFAEGRPWLLQDSLAARLLRRLIARVQPMLQSVPCRHDVPHDYSIQWPTTGLAAFVPKPSERITSDDLIVSVGHS